jgi:hypothetical protein
MVCPPPPAPVAARGRRPFYYSSGVALFSDTSRAGLRLFGPGAKPDIETAPEGWSGVFTGVCLRPPGGQQSSMLALHLQTGNANLHFTAHLGLPSHAMPCHAMPCHAMPCHAAGSFPVGQTLCFVRGHYSIPFVLEDLDVNVNISPTLQATASKVRGGEFCRRRHLRAPLLLLLLLFPSSAHCSTPWMLPCR